MNYLNENMIISFQDNVAVGVTDEMVLYEVVWGLYRNMLSKNGISEDYHSPLPGTLSWAEKRFVEYYGRK